MAHERWGRRTKAMQQCEWRLLPDHPSGAGEGGEALGAVGAGSCCSHPLMAPSNQGRHRALAVGTSRASAGSRMRGFRELWPHEGEGSPSAILTTAISDTLLSPGTHCTSGPKAGEHSLDSEMNVKLEDFGFKMFQFEPYESLKVDIWSMGVVLSRMVMGELPFVGKNFEELSTS
ncbi:hypothetical protein QTO34_008046 [Cnephaeus nilssonii]|uniref:Protein kinase domain-containing protein n=1 Tax=Cnephaeus nilssonii TaxID=3371016 RepID=A0AA40LVW7_CNENI|nr:hypothetical protein QTO34_008046 [Eptesicus nilssonii]